MSMYRFQATPFVPGRTQGILQTVSGGVLTEPALLLVDHKELMNLRLQNVAGLVVVGGAPLSHAMIHLLGLGIPVVIVTPEQAAQLPQGIMLMMDGATGLLASSAKNEPSSPITVPETPELGLPIMSADGKAVELRASVRDASGAKRAVEFGAASIGLVRSEFFNPADGSMPEEDFFYAVFHEICESAYPLALNVRLLDLAMDKLPPWLGDIAGMEGPLGLQGSRLYGIEPVHSVFQAQVKALARLAQRYEISLLLPYLVHREEFLRWRQEIRLITPISLGAMVETPAAALQTGEWLQCADFLSIGCNDLMECLFAADRNIAEVAALLDPYAPVLWLLLRQMAQAAGGKLQRVQVCGLLPQVPGALPLFIGLGYRVFSVEPLLIPYLAKTVASTDSRAAAQLVAKVCRAPDAAWVRALLGFTQEPAWALGAATVGR